MGCGFPLEAWKGKKILYVLGGIGSAALKATIEYTLEHRKDYAGIQILYGATHPTNFTYWYDVKEWQKRDHIELVLTIDRLRLPLTGCGIGCTPVRVPSWIVLGDNRVYNSATREATHEVRKRSRSARALS